MNPQVVHETKTYPIDNCNEEESVFQLSADAIEQEGISVIKNALRYDKLIEIQQLVKDMRPNKFRTAGVGQQLNFNINNKIRTDSILWLDNSTELGNLWLNWADDYRRYLNYRFMMGLRRFESHIAHYSKGDFYQTHTDNFKGKNSRFLSVILYLNTNWKKSEGGELVVYPKGNTAIKILPEAGTLVSFLSKDFPHQVLPARRDRYSITGWFRTDHL